MTTASRSLATALPKGALRERLAPPNYTTTEDTTLFVSDNGMDKLTLPILGSGGPAKYDNEALLFTRSSTSSFDLIIASGTDKASWAKKSNAIGGTFSMAGGRNWGVF
jgi:hypothetical protein